MWRLGGLLALLAAATRAQDVPRPTRLRIYEVRTALRFNRRAAALGLRVCGLAAERRPAAAGEPKTGARAGRLAAA